MRKLSINFYWLLMVAGMSCAAPSLAQSDSVPSQEVVKLHYYNDNNKVQYVMVEARLKTGKKFQGLKNRVYQLYLDSNRAENLITKVKTDTNGKAKAFLPPNLKATWESASQHTFIVVAEATHKEEETTTEFEYRKSRITLDTATEDGVRSIAVEVMKQVEGEWVPAPDIEMKVGIRRLGGILSGGEDETYTTDSTGKVMVEFKKDSLPGDQYGNIILVAKVEDNDELGNLIVEKKANWGVAFQEEKGFFEHRSLWSIASKSPVWLLLMAFFIIVGVWGTIVYLIFQIVKIKKLATDHQ